MAIDRLDFDNLAENDLNELVSAQVPEGLRIDYKRDTYGDSKEDKREVLKDVSAFANAFGGHLIIGIEEKDRIPIKIPGVSNVNPDDEMRRLGQLIRDGIEPRIQGIRINAVPLTNKAHCFVLRIPRSWYPPHRVGAQNWNRFFVRNSSGVHEASVEELRTMFTLGADALHRIHEFRNERLREIKSGNPARQLQSGGRLILHIVPLSAVASLEKVNLELVSKANKSFPTLGDTSFSSRFNFEGFVNERPGPPFHGYTQIFRNGAVEATKAKIVGQTGIPGQKLERDIFMVLPNYFTGLRDIGVTPPLVILLTLDGVKGYPYIVEKNIFEDFPPPIEHDPLYLPDCIINDYGSEQDYHRAVRPAIDALWNAAGRESAQSFSDDGVWVGIIRK